MNCHSIRGREDDLLWFDKLCGRKVFRERIFRDQLACTTHQAIDQAGGDSAGTKTDDLFAITGFDRSPLDSVASGYC